MTYEKIRFNAPYTKLHGQKYATLVNVDVYVFGDYTSKETIEYDTAGGDYNFKPGETYIQLVFLGDKEIPFTTYRKYHRRKVMYYVRRVGQVFEIVIGDGE